MAFSFIEELSEAKLFKTPIILDNQYTIKELSETFFTALLILEFLQIVAPELAANYAEKTLEIDNLNLWRSSGSDLHNIAHILCNPLKYKNKIKNDKFITFPKLKFNSYLRNLASGKRNEVFLLKLQQTFRINSSVLRKIRRKLASWERCTEHEKTVAITNLYLLLRKNLKQTDLYNIAKFALRKTNMIEKDIDIIKAESPAWHRLMQKN